jgi:periplasmic protein TonB
MTLEVQRVSRVSQDSFGSLRSCLVEGDPQSEKRARRIKQRAVAISILLQTLTLAALVLVPLLSKGEHIPMRIVTPLPPYKRGTPPHAESTPHQPDHRPNTTCYFCPPTSAPIHIALTDPRPTNESPDPVPGTPSGPIGDPNGTPFGAEDLNPRHGPARPSEETPKPAARHQVSEPVQMAQLINRVEPRYPPLAIQTHHEGRVELHAVISTAGTIESLEVISGDPFFIQSALAAVRQWRYHPTILNGNPIEVDTHITVIYTLSH